MEIFLGTYMINVLHALWYLILMIPVVRKYFATFYEKKDYLKSRTGLSHLVFTITQDRLGFSIAETHKNH
jgi:hypothetical protein